MDDTRKKRLTVHSSRYFDEMVYSIARSTLNTIPDTQRRWTYPALVGKGPGGVPDRVCSFPLITKHPSDDVITRCNTPETGAFRT